MPRYLLWHSIKLQKCWDRWGNMSSWHQTPASHYTYPVISTSASVTGSGDKTKQRQKRNISDFYFRAKGFQVVCRLDSVCHTQTTLGFDLYLSRPTREVIHKKRTTSKTHTSAAWSLWIEKCYYFASVRVVASIGWISLWWPGVDLQPVNKDDESTQIGAALETLQVSGKHQDRHRLCG